jgi:hypothetical protein
MIVRYCERGGERAALNMDDANLNLHIGFSGSVEILRFIGCL